MLLRPSAPALWALLILQTASFPSRGRNAVSQYCRSNEIAMVRDFFYIGGKYVYESSYNSSIYSDQMYVEKLTPVLGAKHAEPLVFINAGVPSGAAWLNTPDNRMGWASYFVSRGYLVYILDITSVGRSSQSQTAIYPMKIASTVTITEDDYTAPELIHPYPQSVNHTQWPGNGTQGDPYFDAFMKAMIPLSSNSVALELSMRSAGCKLLSMIGRKSYVISHSAGATYAMLISDHCPSLIKGSINLEPGNTPFQNLVGNSTVPAVGYSFARPCGLTSTMIAYDPPVTNCSQLQTVVVGRDTPGKRSFIMQAEPARQLKNIAKVPYVAITGAASPHITYDHCTVAYLELAGVRTEWIRLGERGVEGNGHFLYLEGNNLEIAGVVEGWIGGRG